MNYLVFFKTEEHSNTSFLYDCLLRVVTEICIELISEISIIEVEIEK